MSRAARGPAIAKRRGLAAVGRRALAAILLLAAACAPVPLGDGPRRELVRELTSGVVVPTLEQTATATDALVVAVDALVAAPTPATLRAAQERWRSARLPWKQSEAFGFGPATDDRLAPQIDQPIEPRKIDEELAGTAALTTAYVDSIGADRKGFHALEYLLFEGGEAAVVEALTSDPGAARRRDLLVALAHSLAGKTRALITAWAPDGFAVTLTSPGADNPRYPTIKSVIDTFVNESVFLAELIADARLGKPLGLTSGGTPQPELEESGPSDTSLDDAAASLGSIQLIYEGRGDVVGIGQLVAAQSPVTDREVSALIARSIEALAAIPRPFRSAIVDHREKVQAAYDTIKELKRLLATEVLALLGATLKFNDNDGD
jgi:predicted lipoprotein